MEPQLLGQCFGTVLLLLRDPAREVVSAVVSFIRVGVVAVPDDILSFYLKDMIEGLFASKNKLKFRAKIKAILKKCIRKFGYERIVELTPTEDRKLLANIQKQVSRGDRMNQEIKNNAGNNMKRHGKTSWDKMLNDEDDDNEEHHDMNGNNPNDNDSDGGMEDDNFDFGIGANRSKNKKGGPVRVLNINQSGKMNDEMMDILSNPLQTIKQGHKSKGLPSSEKKT